MHFHMCGIWDGIFGIWDQWYIWNLKVLILYFGWNDNNGNMNDVDANMDRTSTCFGRAPNCTPTPPFPAHITNDDHA